MCGCACGACFTLFTIHVVPAYKEVSNIRPLTERLFAALQSSNNDNSNAELIIVDDNSNDGTEEQVKQLESEGYG